MNSTVLICIYSQVFMDTSVYHFNATEINVFSSMEVSGEISIMLVSML